MAQALGKKPAEVTKFDFRKFEEQAAIASVADELRACAKAKKDNSNAGCSDPLEAFKESSGKSEPTNENEKKTFRKELAKKVVNDARKESIRACMKESTATKVSSYLQEAQSDIDDVASIAFQGETNKKLEMKKKQAEMKATMLALGDEFRDCMQAAGNNTSERSACETKVKGKKDILGVKTPMKHVLKNYRADLLLSPADSCNSTEIKVCRQNAKQEAINNGMIKRAYAADQKKELKGAAENHILRDGETPNRMW